MTHGARKAKGRRLQVTVAEAIARHCGLTIAAFPPTKPGERNDVVWVPEHQAPDLAVRTMGQAGADVALLSTKAMDRVKFMSHPLWIECKNTEAWDFGAYLWRTGTVKFVERAMRQAESAKPDQSFRPVIVLGKNNWPPIVVWKNNLKFDMSLGVSDLRIFTFFDRGTWAATPLDSFVNLLWGVE